MQKNKRIKGLIDINLWHIHFQSLNSVFKLNFMDSIWPDSMLAFVMETLWIDAQETFRPSILTYENRLSSFAGWSAKGVHVKSDARATSANACYKYASRRHFSSSKACVTAWHFCRERGESAMNTLPVTFPASVIGSARFWKLAISTKSDWVVSSISLQRRLTEEGSPNFREKKRKSWKTDLKMRVLFLLSLLVCAASAASFFDLVVEEWATWKLLHGNSYHNSFKHRLFFVISTFNATITRSLRAW